MTGKLVLPWPPKVLSPNARAHWAARSLAAKKYRRACKLLTLKHGVRAPEGRVLLSLVFCPPNACRRDDDNCVAAFKSGRDGLADALGIDDSRFVTRFEMGQRVKGGAVVVSIQGEVGE